MRIGLIFDHFDERKGGAEIYLSRLAGELSARGHEYRVYCLDGTSSNPSVAVIPVRTSAHLRGALDRELALRGVAQAREDCCDVIHGVRHLLEADVYQPHGGTYAASREARQRIAREGVAQGLKSWWGSISSRNRFFEEADRAIFECNPRLITVAVSKLVHDDIRARFGAACADLRVLHPGIDTSRFHPGLRQGAGLLFRKRTGIKENAPVGLFVGHDFALKGLQQALESFAKSAPGRKEGHLLIAGRGDVEAFRRVAEQYNLKGRSWFVQDRCEMAELYGAADFLLQPTRYDPCSLSTLEALSSGVPVITTAANGAGELVSQGGGGIVVHDADDVAALAGAVERVMEERDGLSEKARASVGSLDWSLHASSMARIFEEARSRRS